MRAGFLYGNAVAWDNLPVKGYVYPLAAVPDFHMLDKWVYAEDGQTRICVPGLEE